VGLTGGCFSNRLLTELTCEKLSSAGFRVLTHRQVPAGDGGIALGQALYGMCRLQNIKESGKR
jgi:hydrogenase maturation protein HypF